MNTIDLLDKLNFPVKIGLEGENALFNRMTIMDAYLSAAALEQSILNSTMNSYGFNNSDRSQDYLFAQPQNQNDFGGISQPNLFKQIEAGSKLVDQEDSNDTKIALDLSKFKDLWQIEADDRKQRMGRSQDDSKGHDQIDTESDSFNRLEADFKAFEKPEAKKVEKKTDKSDVGSLINDERRRLLKKLDSCDDDRIVFKRREKNGKKDPKVSADTYRGSRYWGVSKNKSKWQVCYFF